MDNRNTLKDFEIDGTTLVRYLGTNPDVVIPDFITDVAGYADDYGRCWFAFGTYGSGEYVKSMTIPKSLTNIDGWTFHMCHNLEKIIVDEQNEMYYSEGNCIIEKESKTLIVACQNSVIPQDIKKIACRAFIKCEGFANVNYNGTKRQWNAIEKHVCWDDGLSVYTIHCTDGDITFDDEPFKIWDTHLWSYRGHSDKVVIPDFITYISADSYMGIYCFAGCDFIKSITVPKGVTDIDGDTFHGCSNIEEIIVDSQNSKYYSQGNCVINKENKKLLAGCKTSVIPEDVTGIGDSAFFERTGLTSIRIPSGIKFIGDSAFEGCSNLTTITLPEGVTYIGEDAFSGCTSLRSITLPNSIKYIVDGAFSGCRHLTNLTIPDSVEIIGKYAFSGCSGLTNITIPNSVTNIDYGAFNYCSNLEEINVDSTNSVYYSQGNCLIEKESKTLVVGCKSSVIPDDIKVIGDSSFSGCSNLTSISIPDSVTNIDYGAFYGCSGLTSITIPNSVKNIGGSAFGDCIGLTDIVYKGMKSQLRAITVDGCCNDKTGNYIFHCIDGDVDKYGNDVES